LVAQDRDFLVGEAVGQKEIPLLLELPDLLGREFHGRSSSRAAPLGGGHFVQLGNILTTGRPRNVPTENPRHQIASSRVARLAKTRAIWSKSGLDQPEVAQAGMAVAARSEEHTSELQSLAYLVCR